MPVELLDQSQIAPANRPRTAANMPKDEKGPRLGRAAQGGTLSTITIIAMGIFHVRTVAALFLFSWKPLVFIVILWV